MASAFQMIKVNKDKISVKILEIRAIRVPWVFHRRPLPLKSLIDELLGRLGVERQENEQHAQGQQHRLYYRLPTDKDQLIVFAELDPVDEDGRNERDQG